MRSEMEKAMDVSSIKPASKIEYIQIHLPIKKED
jgi:hypothetical protein